MCLNKLLILFLLPIVAIGQSSDSSQSSVDKKGLRRASIAAGAVYTGSLFVLNKVWYENNERQSFRFFDDNPEWKQIDKLGHFYSSFYLTYGISRGLQAYNLRPKKADLIGAIVGFGVLLPIEVFDGFSPAYGASVGDLAADAAGPLFYLAQQAIWKDVRLIPKFSFRYTDYAAMRPSVLGSGAERILKDYNGETYWLSVDMDKFVRFPKWLNLAVGYGANGMVYARDAQQSEYNLSPALREYYLSLDLDLSGIRTRSKGVKTLLFVLNMVKIPSPTLRFTSEGTRFFPAFF